MRENDTSTYAVYMLQNSYGKETWFFCSKERRVCILRPENILCQILRPNKKGLLIIKRLKTRKLLTYIIVRLTLSAAESIKARLYWKFYYCCSCGKFNGIT